MRRPAAVVLALAAASPAHADVRQADSAESARLVARARIRHQEQESLLGGYRARVFTRMEGGVGAGRFGRSLNLVAFETASNVHWQRPNDLRIDVLGMRSRTVRIPGFSDRGIETFWTETFTGEPWFVPRSLGDEIQILGIPDVPALHPLARDGNRYYTYALADSVTLFMPGRTVRAVAVEVRPRQYGPMLVSGTMWLDADSLDVVRLSVAFVGEGLWEDDEPDSPELVQLEADLEYALHDGQYWLPLRQILTGAWTYGRYIPGATLTTTAVTTFTDYDVDPGAALAFSSPGSRRWTRGTWEWDWEWGRECERCGDHGRSRTHAWDGGRWEVNLPSLDSLHAFDFGVAFDAQVDLMDDEVIAQRYTELALESEALPDGWTGRRLLDLDWTEAIRFLGFNRVQGLSVSLATALRPGADFTTLSLSGRFSAADSRLTGSATWRRAAPRGVLGISVFRHVRDVEPWTAGLTLGNTAKALFLGHDDADYYLATGGGFTYVGERGVTRNVTLGFQVERQASLARRAGSTLHQVLFGDGAFQENPAVREGVFVRARLERVFPFSGGKLRLGTSTLTGDGLFDARFWSMADIAVPVGRRTLSVGLRGGAVVGDRTPQMEFRLGGPATVRGHTYGVQRGRAFWAVQSEMVLTGNQWVAPVIFGDVGGLFDGAEPLAGIGVGLSAFKGWMRIDAAKSVTTGAPVRVDVWFTLPH